MNQTIDDKITLDLLSLSQSLTKREREKLQTLAAKITKVPDKINIPVEYMVQKRERERK